MVLLFHTGLPWIGGGYFGVSVFFTLSGFLITRLLLAEADSTGRVSFSRFYGRRLKRLLPASLICLLAIVVIYWLGEFRLVPGMRVQLWGALGQFYNWVRITGSSSYIELVGSAPALVSPLEHYWSLAIEEQFYLIWPLALWLIVRWSRRSSRDAVWFLAAMAAVCAVVAPLVAALFSANVAYWSTPTRLGELVVGATAAAWCRRGAASIRWASAVAALSLVSLLVLAALLPVGSGPAYGGWMTPLALLTALLIVSLQAPSAVRSLLSLAPLVWVGRISYGLYLYHWPVFVLLRAHGWQLDRPGGFLLALGITFAVAVASYQLVEAPIRRSSWSPRRVMSRATLGACVVAAAIAVVPVSRGFLEPNQRVLDAAAITPDDSVAPLLPAPDRLPAGSSREPTPVVSSPQTLTLALPAVPSRPVRILVVGDSTAFFLGQGLADWAADHPEYAQVTITFCFGCGFLRDGKIIDYDLGGAERRTADLLDNEVPSKVRELQPDVIVLMATTVDVLNRRWQSTEGQLSPYDSVFRSRLNDAYSALTGALLEADSPTTVVWVVPPVPSMSWPDVTKGPVDRGRYLVQHDVIRDVARAAGPRVSVMELDDWFSRAEHSNDDSWRPDGSHLTEQAATRVATDYVGPWIVATALRSATG